MAECIPKHSQVNLVYRDSTLGSGVPSQLLTSKNPPLYLKYKKLQVQIRITSSSSPFTKEKCSVFLNLTFSLSILMCHLVTSSFVYFMLHKTICHYYGTNVDAFDF